MNASVWERSTARRTNSVQQHRPSRTQHCHPVIEESEAHGFDRTPMHVDVSLLVLLCHLSDRFGKVTPSGTSLNIGLTHEDLGKLVGATRQSVSDALGRLAGRELLVRRTDKSRLLSPHAPDEIEDLLPPRPRRRPGS